MKNYINVSWTPDTTTITTFIGGQPLAWINYNATDLPGLIALLQQAQNAMTGGEAGPGAKKH